MEGLAHTLYLVHLVSTGAMAGIICFCQLAYYPNLAHVGKDAFLDYQKAHIKGITAWAWAMLLLELLTAIALLVLLPQLLPAANLVLLLSIWCSTWFLQVPCHKKLERDGFDEKILATLVRSNVLRVVLYIVRLVLLIFFSLNRL